jgi:PAS domain S-box-containing protein
MIPHAWSPQERVLLREVADFLGVALRNAEATTRLEESERRFRQLAESSQAVIVLHQKEGAVYLNPEFVRLSGYPADELHQTSLWDVIHLDDVQMIREYRGHWLDRQGTPARSEVRIVTKSGDVCWLDVRVSTFELSGELTILVAGLDITERKLWEQDLRAGEERLRTLMEHLTDGVSLIVDGRCVYVNPGLARLVGCTTEELVGQNPLDILVPDDRPRGPPVCRRLRPARPIPGRSMTCCGGTAPPSRFWPAVSVSNLMVVR